MTLIFTGEEGYKQDAVQYDADLDVIYQYHSKKRLDTSLIAGISSVETNHSTHFEGNTPNQILPNNQRLNLRDISKFGPDDCAVAMQWQINELKENEVKIFPVIMVMGFGQEEFMENCRVAKAHLNELMPRANRSFRESGRLNVDPKLKDMAFSMTEWCKNPN